MEESWLGVVKVAIMLDCLHAYPIVVWFCNMSMIQLLFFLGSAQPAEHTHLFAEKLYQSMIPRTDCALS